MSHPRMQRNESARFPTQTSQPRVQCTDHEATGSPDCYILGPYMIKCLFHHVNMVFMHYFYVQYRIHNAILSN